MSNIARGHLPAAVRPQVASSSTMGGIACGEGDRRSLGGSPPNFPNAEIKLKRDILQMCESMDLNDRMKILRYLVDNVDASFKICEAADGSRVNLDLFKSAFLLDLADYVDDVARVVPVEFQIG
tara:strand:- start:4 stop:375 length:372 start_codon:yes stop_codon:yes gene_type:complete